MSGHITNFSISSSESPLLKLSNSINLFLKASGIYLIKVKILLPALEHLQNLIQIWFLVCSLSKADSFHFTTNSNPFRYQMLLDFDFDFDLFIYLF